jgi:uncharacterized damage-inducible protein DinB
MMRLDDFLYELAQEAVVTRSVLERVPAGKMHWRPHPRARTLGELAAHIATLPGDIAEMARRDTFEVAEIASSRSMTAAELPAALDESLATARAALAGLRNESLVEMWHMVAAGKSIVSMPRAALLRSIMLNHWYHHRGQLTVYLRELDAAVPSIYGPSADENPFAPRDAAPEHVPDSQKA